MTALLDQGASANTLDTKASSDIWDALGRILCHRDQDARVVHHMCLDQSFFNGAGGFARRKRGQPDFTTQDEGKLSSIGHARVLSQIGGVKDLDLHLVSRTDEHAFLLRKHGGCQTANQQDSLKHSHAFPPRPSG